MIRIQKLIAKYGYTSRRKAEKLIKEGRVAVNGIIIKEPGEKIPENSEITVNGKIINREIKDIYLIMNKPKGYLCTRNDPFKRKTIYDLLDKKYINYGVFNVGRLDKMSEGLLIITNDGYLANKVMHPSNNIEKKYLVECKEKITTKIIAKWTEGIYIKGNYYKIKSFDIDEKNPKRVTITLNEGKKREIRELFKSINRDIVMLRRISIANLTLGDLKPGEYKELSKKSIYQSLGIPVPGVKSH